MGGCRCSFRNCNVRSVGRKTHMFHFPVFDRVRCHQWIKNANKPNFLNLKLSQLKNRNICQHHFTDDNFMNYKKDKLKQYAVPTEYGPYCTPDTAEPDIEQESDKPVMTISADDIENDKLDSVEKKAHSSVTYGDFLISDATDLFNASIESQGTVKKVTTGKLGLVKDTPHLEYKFSEDSNHKYTLNYMNEDTIKPNTSPKKSIPSARLMAIEIDDTPNVPNISNTINASNNQTISKSISTPATRSKFNPNKMVKIISERMISEPVKVEGKLEPISPSMIIKKPNKVRKIIPMQHGGWGAIPIAEKQESKEVIQANIEPMTTDNTNVIYEQTIPIEYIPDPFQVDKNDQNSVIPSTINEQGNIVQYEPLHDVNLNTIENKKTQYENVVVIQQPIDVLMEKSLEPSINTPKKLATKQTPLKSLLKHKITPEKLAAIEEKRKFNLKMRDVITSCLDNLDESNDDIVKKIAEEKKKTERRSLLKPLDSSITNQNTIIAYLENRLQKLESTLINKIEHNTSRINELKRTYKPLSNKKNVTTQTNLIHMCEDSQKHYLYKEISKFLSPDANITVFQELFTNNEEEPARKLRKRTINLLRV